MHPETGIAYWRAAIAGYGVVDFEGLDLIPYGRWHDQYAGTGFASADPTTLLDVSAGLSAGPVIVRAAGGDVVHTFTGVHTFLERPDSVGLDMAAGAFYLSGRTRVAAGQFDAAVIVSRNGGSNWVKIGDRSGQLYFLSDRAEVFLQTEDDLLRYSVATSVSPRGKRATTWGALRAGR